MGAVGAPVTHSKVDALGAGRDDVLCRVDVDHDGREDRMEAWQPRHQPAFCERPRGRHSDRVAAGRWADRGKGAGHMIEAVAQQREDRVSLRRQRDGASGAFEQFASEGGLELADLMADRRHRNAEFIGGRGEALVARGGLECTDRVEGRQLAHGGLRWASGGAGSGDQEVGVCRRHVVHRHHVLRAGGEHHDQVHLGAQRDGLAGLADRRPEAQRAIGRHRHVHEEIEGRGRRRRRKPDCIERQRQVLRAIVVVTAGAELPIAVDVAGSDQGVVNPWGGVGHQGEDRTPPVGHERIAHPRHQLQHRGAAVLHGHELAGVAGAEGPGVHHLLAVGVQHGHRLAGLEARRDAVPRRNELGARCVDGQ